jgi:hypothetical protein
MTLDIESAAGNHFSNSLHGRFDLILGGSEDRPERRRPLATVISALVLETPLRWRDTLALDVLVELAAEVVALPAGAPDFVAQVGQREFVLVLAPSDFLELVNWPDPII